jgi:hypothetical protein
MPFTAAHSWVQKLPLSANVVVCTHCGAMKPMQFMGAKIPGCRVQSVRDGGGFRPIEPGTLVVVAYQSRRGED